MNENELECLATVATMIGRELQQIPKEQRRYAVARLERLQEQFKNGSDANIRTIGVQTIHFMLKAWLDFGLNETIKNAAPTPH